MKETTIELTISIMLDNNITMEELKKRHNLPEERIIRFLTDNMKEQKVRDFLINYYSQFNIKDNKAIIIADTHLGAVYGDYNLLHVVYNFALKKNIKNIIHVGDIIEGKVNPYVVSPSEEVQVEKLLKKYPRVKEINTYSLLGNHDYPAQNKVIKALNILGHINIGNLQSYVKLNDSFLFVNHVERNGVIVPKLDYSLCVQGHGHNYYFHKESKTLGIPALCLDYNKSCSNSSFIVLTSCDTEYVVEKYNFKSNYQPLLNDEQVLSLKKTY